MPRRRHPRRDETRPARSVAARRPSHRRRAHHPAVSLSIGGSVYDPTDAVGRLLLNVLAMVAELESDLIRLRTCEGMRVARAKGRLRGKQPKLYRRQAALLSPWCTAVTTAPPRSLSTSASAAPPSTAPLNDSATRHEPVSEKRSPTCERPFITGCPARSNRAGHLRSHTRPERQSPEAVPAAGRRRDLRCAGDRPRSRLAIRRKPVAPRSLAALACRRGVAAAGGDFQRG